MEKGDNVLPIWEYQCKKCGYIFEQIQFKEIPKIGTTCPVCKDIARRILSSSNFKVKGYSAANNYSKKDK